MKSPVLFIVFNRPETTRKVFQAIRGARPPKLYIAADGPRVERPDEARRCAEVRRIAELVDWPCEIHRLFRDENVGCKLGVAGAVSWFFSQETEGIILVDDVLPVATFFDFCDEMLLKYRDDLRVAMVSGCNLVSNHFEGRESYFFSRYNNIWGWASWRRAWQHFDVAMSAWPAWRDENGLASVSGGNAFFVAYWKRAFDAAHGGSVDAWSYSWLLSTWRSGGLAILPALNQITNIGFGHDATHTNGDPPKYISSSRPQPLSFPLVHPTVIAADARADSFIGSRIFGINAVGSIKSAVASHPIIKRFVGALKPLKKLIR